MQKITVWVYIVLSYNVLCMGLLYAIPSVRWNESEKHIRSISGILSIFHTAGIIGFGGLYATLFLVFTIASMKESRLFALSVLMMVLSMGVLGFDITEHHTMHVICFVALQLSLVAFANQLQLETVCVKVLNACTAVFILIMVCNASGLMMRSTQSVVELVWAGVCVWYVVLVTRHIETI